MMVDRTITIDYTNWKGVRRSRKVIPTGKREFKVTQYHPTPEWLFEAYCLEDGFVKWFSEASVVYWSVE